MPMQSMSEHSALSFDDAKVNWQTAELGKVDVGGGGTIAYIMSLYGMEVIDSGVPVSKHACSVGSNQQSRYLRGKESLCSILERTHKNLMQDMRRFESFGQ